MHVDVIVIGSGQAGVPLAARLARAGRRTILVERGALGGTCVNTGCTPTKTMIASARAAHVARTAGRLGVHAREVVVDFPAVVRRKDAIVESWRASVRKKIEQGGERLTLLRGHARFVDAHTVDVNGERHASDTVVLNVGARPLVPRIPGLDAIAWLDNRTVMELATLPDHLVILGGGYVGCEFGQMFRRFGSAVTIAGRSPHLLSREDEEISDAIEGVFRAEGIDLALGTAVESVARDGAGIAARLADGRVVRGSHLLVAVGRRPNTDDLGCDAAGIRLDDRGFIEIGSRYDTSAPGVYAVGDAAGEPQFTHVSWDDHRLLFEILAGQSGATREGRHIPYTTFTDPQVAGVGLTERQAKEKGMAYETATMPFARVARAVETDETAGLLKVLIDPATERLLGAAIVGAEAGELIHVFVALMQAGAPARAIVDAEFVHPTFAEGVQSVVMRLPRYRLS